MKKYTKPMLVTLSISANDMLCQGCGYDAIIDGSIRRLLQQNGIEDIYGDGYDTGDLGNLFASSEDMCMAQPDNWPNYEAYCKFSPQESNKLFLS